MGSFRKTRFRGPKFHRAGTPENLKMGSFRKMHSRPKFHRGAILESTQMGSSRKMQSRPTRDPIARCATLRSPRCHAEEPQNGFVS